MDDDKIELVFTISPDGEVAIAVSGVKGKACLDETRSFERGLSGGKVESRTLTSEYYEEPIPAGASSSKGRHSKKSKK